MAKVIQADRDCAQEWCDGAMMGVAGYDFRSLVEAFASHREASTAKLEADMAMLVEVLREAIYWDGRDAEGVDAVWLNDAEALVARIQGEYRSGEVGHE